MHYSSHAFDFRTELSAPNQGRIVPIRGGAVRHEYDFYREQVLLSKEPPNVANVFAEPFGRAPDGDDQCEFGQYAALRSLAHGFPPLRPKSCQSSPWQRYAGLANLIPREWRMQPRRSASPFRYVEQTKFGQGLPLDITFGN